MTMGTKWISFVYKGRSSWAGTGEDARAYIGNSFSGLKSSGRGRIVRRVALGGQALQVGASTSQAFPPCSSMPCWLRPQDLTVCSSEGFRG